jgi:siroheme synthase (precorrin-2 oxidase/ferrochelatase)
MHRRLTLNGLTQAGTALEKKLNHGARRVLIVGTGSIFEQGVESLLAREANVQVSEITHTQEDAFIQDVLRVQPDVIVFHEIGAFNSDRIFELLKALPEMDTLRVIILRSANSAIDLYEKRTLSAAQAQDFVNLVCGWA